MQAWTVTKLDTDVVVFLAASADALCGAVFSRNERQLPAGYSAEARDDAHPVLRQAVTELAEYLAGQRRSFSVAFELEGSEFQCRVWEQLMKIPFGEVRSYADIAAALGNPKAVRAVGAANGRNPLPIFVPCHRVIASNGSLAGYSGGVEIKALLLRIEGVLL